jgi:hypothetical protein
MSHPVGQDQPLMVPLTARTVTSLHKSCPDLQCIGDLKYWALTSMQRRKLSFDLGCTLSISKWHCEKKKEFTLHISLNNNTMLSMQRKKCSMWCPKKMKTYTWFHKNFKIVKTVLGDLFKVTLKVTKHKF